MFGLHGSAYLSVVMDLYNIEMWHWELSQRNNVYVVIGDTSECGATRRLLTDYILFYNEERCQNKLGDLSPVEFREKAAT
ncbi:IS3 family transposase [Paenibacillus taichungensis]